MSESYLGQPNQRIIDWCKKKCKEIKPLCFTAEYPNSTIRFDCNGRWIENYNYLQYSIDKENWNDYIGQTLTLTNIGDKIYFNTPEGITNHTWGADYEFKFVMTGRISASGNIMSLSVKDGQSKETPQEKWYFFGLFMDCKSLTTAPELPATTISEQCYKKTFYGCTSLIDSPKLPSVALTYQCYYSMFENCTSLTSTPELPAETLANNCYEKMFSGCTSLTATPELPATTLAESCYARMFQDCSQLISVPNLSSMSLTKWCYYYMFAGCTKLEKTIELPATTLANSCYGGMFSGCTSLSSLFELPATKLDAYCYYKMFENCTSLSISENTEGGTKVLDIPSGTQTYGSWNTNMFSNTAGTFKGEPSIGKTYRCYTEQPFEYKGLCFTAEQDGSSVKLQNVAGTYQTSTDGKKWDDYALGTPINLNQGQKVYFAAKTTNSTCWNNNSGKKFQMSGKIKASGNIQSLLDKECKRMDVPEYCYAGMFSECTSLTQAPQLPAATLATGCYNNMFEGCTSLTIGPETIPATELAYYCCGNMFNNCTSLTQAPQLPATTMSTFCYYSMFKGCTSLTQAPQLPSTTLADCCYAYMFSGCTSLTQAPQLQATTLADYCYDYMFSRCTSLTQAPELPATTMSTFCYSFMFNGCTSLTNAYFPNLPQDTVIDEVVAHQYAFYDAASNIETQCSDGIIYINDNN